MTKEEREFIKQTAKDSFDMKVDVEAIRKAYKLFTNIDLANIRVMRREMFNIHTNPNLLDTKTEEAKTELPTPERFKKRIESAGIVQEVPSSQITKQESQPKVPTVKVADILKVDKRSKAYKDSLKK